MSLTILSVAYPFARVGPDAVGGAEQVLCCIDAALVAAGHRSIVIAAEGSVARGDLVPIVVPTGTITDRNRSGVHRHVREAIRRAAARERVDLIHLHGVDFLDYLPDTSLPVLITLHLPPAWYPPSAFTLDRPATYLHCVSASQRSACPPCAGLLPEIRNGVPVGRLGPRLTKRRFALTMGRICPEKNHHVALDAAAAAGVPILLAGQVFPYEAHERYFQDQIAPRLGRASRFIGPVGFERKRRLLAAARCLVVPSLAPETSSLVAMEALASGTPVVATRVGALPEIVDHGRTGFLVDDPASMAAAIRECDHLSPAQCRDAALARFSVSRMSSEYLATYHRLAGGTIRRRAPRTGAPRVEVITTIGALESIRQEWSRLCATTPRSTPFHRPEWLITWWRSIGQGELWVLTVRAPGPSHALVGLLPLYLCTEPGSGPRLLPIGVATTDYTDGLFHPDWQAAGAAAALAHIAAHSPRGAPCDLSQLRAGSPLLTTPAPCPETTTPTDPCPVLRLPGSLAALRKAVPANIAQNLRYYRRRAQRTPGFAIERVASRRLDEFLDALIGLHARRWSSRNQPGVLADPAVQQAHRDAIPQLDRAGLLRPYAIRLSGAVVAALYALADTGADQPCHYYYLGGFDPEFSRLSPGTLLIGHAIEEAVREGAAAFDFLRGREPYKYLWGAQDTPVFRRQLRPGSGAGVQHIPLPLDPSTSRAAS